MTKLEAVNRLVRMRKQIGDWSLARALRKHVSFPTAYFIMFGRSPKRI